MKKTKLNKKVVNTFRYICKAGILKSIAIFIATRKKVIITLPDLYIDNFLPKICTTCTAKSPYL